MSLTLAEHIVAAGHACTVVTETVSDHAPPGGFPFPVVRAPSARKRLSLAWSADVVHSNGASVALFPYARLARKPFIWTHGGYQMVSIDGLGWFDDGPAPLGPIKSTIFHARRRGLRVAAVEGMKLTLRRMVGRMVSRNVAVSRWVAKRQPLPKQVVIYNPFPLSRFKGALNRPGRARYDFLFTGRLVSEKGVRTLLLALAEVNRRPGRPPATLLIVGDGKQREALERLAATLGLGPSVHFAGEKRGDDLIETVSQANIAVVPSEWEEPMGGVALELLAAERPLIVSERGGLAECVGDAAWTFPNGDHRALATTMAALFDDARLARSKSEAARRLVAKFDERVLTRQYLDLYRDVLDRARAFGGRPVGTKTPTVSR